MFLHAQPLLCVHYNTFVLTLHRSSRLIKMLELVWENVNIGS